MVEFITDFCCKKKSRKALDHDWRVESELSSLPEVSKLDNLEEETLKTEKIAFDDENGIQQHVSSFLGMKTIYQRLDELMMCQQA